MKVKVGNKIYDGDKEPVMVILSDLDKKNISNMSFIANKYASFPDDYPTDDMKAWMDTSTDNSIDSSDL